MHPKLTRQPLLLLPTLVGFAILLRAAQSDDLGLDGGLSLAIAQLTLADELDFLAHDVHPPLYYLLLRLWVRLVGTTPFAVKALTVFASALSIAVLVGWVRSLGGGRAALIAGSIVAVSPVAIEMSATAREFALSVPAILLLGWAYTSRSRWADWRICIAGAVALWTSYFAAALVAAAALDALVRRERRRRLIPLVAAGLSLLPWIAFIVARGFLNTTSSDGPRQGDDHTNPLAVQLFDTARILASGRQLAPEWLGPALVVVGLALAVALARRGERGSLTPRGSDPLLLLGGGATLTLLLAFVVNVAWTREGMGTRYLVTAVPLLAALFSIACVRTTRAPVAILCMAAPLVLAGTLGTRAWLDRPPAPVDFWDPRSVVEFLDERVQSSDLIVFASPEQAGYYTALSRHPGRWLLVTSAPDYLAGDVYARAEASLRPYLAEKRTIWTVMSHQTNGAPGTVRLVDWLSANAYGVAPERLVDSDVAQHVTYPAADASRGVAARFEGGVVLDSSRFPMEIEPGGVLPVELYWLATEQQSRGRTVFVHLVDETDRKWSQHDSIPVSGRAPLTHWMPGNPIADRRGLALPDDLPSGQYWLVVGLYDDAGRLPLVGGGDAVRLGPLTAGVR